MAVTVFVVAVVPVGALFGLLGGGGAAEVTGRSDTRRHA
jgi:hypothetical protein